MVIKYPFKAFLIAIALIILNGFNIAFAQAPKIAYQTPQVYTQNTPIIPLILNSSGGPVPARAYGQVSTIAGSGLPGSANGTGNTASFKHPIGVITDASGNIYISDTENNMIRKITPAGVVTTFAGNTTVVGADDGTGTAATFDYPHDLAMDKAGNIYVADFGTSEIRVISPAGVVTTLAGNFPNQGKANGTGKAATFANPSGVAVDAAGNVYVADTFNYLIRKITPAGVVTTLAGSGTPAFKDGTGTAASFSGPFSIAVDKSGNLYVTDNATIRKITPAGVVTTFAGNLTSTTVADGTGTAASFGEPFGITIDQNGNLFVCDNGASTIREITPAGVVTTIAGSGVQGSADGIGKAASFFDPWGIANDGLGNLYIADYDNHLIRKVTVTGYAIDKPLPAGLTFDATNGTISGTPSTPSPATDYTVTAYNASGSSSTIINLLVNPAPSTTPPAISYQTPQTYNLNTAIAPLIPKNTGGTPQPNGYTIDKTLPTGLIFDITTGIITGKPNAVSPSTDYKITAVNGAGSSNTTVNISVVDNTILPPKISYQTPLVYTENKPITTLIPANTGGAIPLHAYGEVSTLSNVSLGNPSSVAFDAAGNLYAVDFFNNQIDKITPAGVVTIFAGSGAKGAANGPGKTASFFAPYGMAFDPAGNLYVAEAGNEMIRKITPAGVVSTLAGSGAKGAANGQGASATFNNPVSVACDATGNVYVSDRLNSAIRKIDQSGNASTFAVLDGGAVPANNASGLGYITIDAAGNLYVNDGNQVKMITQGLSVSIIAGNGFPAFANGTGKSAAFSRLTGITLDADGNIYVGDANNNMIRKITPAGMVTTLAGTGAQGSADGPVSTATFFAPYGLALDKSANLYAADAGNNVIRVVSLTGYSIDKPLPAGLVFDPATGNISGTPTVLSPSTDYTVTAYNTAGSSSTVVNITVSTLITSSIAPPNIKYVTPQVYVANTPIPPLAPGNSGGAVPTTFFGLTEAFAGTGNFGTANGSPIVASFHFPEGVASDAAGNLYVGDYGNNLIRKITPAGVTSTLAGNGNSGAINGAPDIARFNGPEGVAIDAAGNVYVADVQNNMIRKVTPAGVVSTFAGSAIPGSSDGTGTAAAFNGPAGVAVDASGNVYVADTQNNLIRKITPAGVVSTLAGSGNPGMNNGTGAAAQFYHPAGIAVDASGNIYVADSGNNLIRMINPAGLVITITGTGSIGSANGSSGTATFKNPSGITVDQAGNIFVGDSGNNLIRMITPQGQVITLAGSGQAGGFNNVGILAQFASPMGLTIDATGNLFVADKFNNQIRKVVTTGYFIDKPLPAGLVFDSSTGIISGTPTAATPATVYTITAYNEGGNNSTQVSIQIIDHAVVVAPPLITYQTPQIYTVNQTITPLSPNNTGGAVPATIYGQISSFAGSGAAGKADGTGTAATFYQPAGLAIDAGGNIYVGDVSNFLIRKITPGGVVTTIPNYTGQPFGLAVDAAGTIYVADAGNNQIEKISPSGVITIIAGHLTPGNINGTGTAASFDEPIGIAVDANGNLYVADQLNNLIRKITPGGVVTTFAGSGAQSETDGTGTSATFNHPIGIAVDPNGNVYVADYGGNKIRKITPAGVVSTIAGSGVKGTSDGTGAQASFFEPEGIAIDASGNLYIADTGNDLIRKITPGGKVTTIAGDIPGAGTLNKNFHQPLGIVLDASGDAYVSEFGGNIITQIILTGYSIDKPLPAGLTFDPKTGIISGTPTTPSLATDYTITAYNTGGSSSFVVNISVIPLSPPLIPAPTISYQTPQVYKVNIGITPLAPKNTGGAVPATIFGQVTTFAGSGTEGSADGIKTAASFRFPHDVAVDELGNVYVADDGNYEIRAITPGGSVSTLAGSGTAGAANGSGAAASFLGPVGITADLAGNLYVADLKNNLIRKINPAGNVTTLAGSPGVVGFADGVGPAASFNYPTGAAVDAAGVIYVADPGNNLIRKVTPDGTVTTIAGTRIGGANDGAAAQATFNSPEAIAVDNAGNLYIADDFNNNIRKITPGGIVSTIAGSLTAGFTDGSGTSAGFHQPVGIDVDAAGNIYVGDTGNNAIRMITPQGNVVTLAGNGTPGNSNGIGKAASFNTPSGLSADGNGNVFVADDANNLIRKVVATGYTIDKPLPAGLTFDVTTGIISGTPTVISPATDYTVTAYNAGGNSSTIVNIAVISGIVTPQTITFGPLPVKTYGDPDFSPGATSSNNTLPVTYSSDNTGVATIVNSQIHITGAGTANITASQEGNDSYSAATPVTQPLTVNKALLTLTADDKTKTAGQANPIFTFSHTPFAYNEDPSVLTAQPVLSTIATINSAVGQYVISIGEATSPNYDITQLAGTLTINPAPESIVVPNAFTPNGDGINDFWNIKSLTDFPQCLVSVYSRNGGLVFQSRGYAKPWDGTYNGSPVPTGTYYYIINPQTGAQKLAGYVTVLR